MNNPENPLPRPVVLCILDGWGWREETENNALALAETPEWDALLKTCPHAKIATSGEAVGLPAGQMGNSEVGHMNIGAGRIAVPELPRIDRAIADGSLAKNPELVRFLEKIRAAGGRLHLLGLLSPGGVHAMDQHMAVMAELAAKSGLKVWVHAFLDGRDTPPSSGLGYVRAFLAAIGKLPNVQIATVAGRYYAMDRDQRWERVARAESAIAGGHGRNAPDALAAIKSAYEAGESDEFVDPYVIGDYQGMQDGDGLFMANFRADRARELLTALLKPEFESFPRSRRIKFSAAAGMVKYSDELSHYLAVLFPPALLPKTLGELVANAGKHQLRIAETEKYAHVTFFLNGGVETVYHGEDRILVPSPRVATYDLQPEMSAPEVTDKLIEAIAAGNHDLIVVNYANPDMVGHTGNLQASILAAECIDRCLGRLAAAVRGAGGVLLITADHGNLEEMLDTVTGERLTQHTTNPVPAVLVGESAQAFSLADGKLADLAPTLLPFLGIAQPPEMTGRSLLRPADARRRSRA